MKTEKVSNASFLEEFTSYESRKSGGEGNHKARELICRTLSQLPGDSLKMTEESFPISYCTQVHSSVTTAGLTIKTKLLEYTGQECEEFAEALISVGYGSSLEFKLRNVHGCIAVCKANPCIHRADQTKNALRAGARALLIISPHEEYFHVGACQSGSSPILKMPVMSIRGKDWQQLKSHLGKKVMLSYARTSSSAEGVNLVVDINNSPESMCTVMGAHYDSWGAGAQDNGIGVLMLIRFIECFVQEKHKGNFRFIFFDGEELGMLGSKWHVENNNIECYNVFFNLEMPLPAKGTYLKTLLFSFSTIKHIPFFSLLAKSYLPCPLNPYYSLCSSTLPMDADAFMKSGIPSISTYCNNPYYHTPADSPRNIRMDQFNTMLSLYKSIITSISQESFLKRDAR
ncbi:MAG: M28 family peptidase [Planctomycetes bacterium]|nr:M28 family peptidase [Planctomycetota bacterium]